MQQRLVSFCGERSYSLNLMHEDDDSKFDRCCFSEVTLIPRLISKSFTEAKNMTSGKEC